MKMSLASLVLAGALLGGSAAAQLPQAYEVPPGQLAPDDVHFLRAADAANMDQLMLGNRAASRARHPGVHSLADNVVASHREADDALRLLASRKNVDLEHRNSEHGQREADELLDRNTALDDEYVHDVVRDYDAIIAMYEDARANSEDADIRRYADIMLEKLHDNLRQATDLLERTGDSR